MASFMGDMQARSLVQQCTDATGLEAHLGAGGAGCRAYVGFDPTADSLTIGNLVGIMALARFQRAGHTPVAVMGGATGLIGDPSGKTAERTLSTRDEVAGRVERIGRIFAGGELFDTTGALPRLEMVNNIDWLGGLGFLDALREVGKHFSVNMMVQKDSVKERLHNREHGISYTEFSYMLLQAYDYFWLHKHKGVTLQMGGSDQFGNIVVGMDLIGKKHIEDVGVDAGRARAFGLTWPLVTKADGGKFGKTESGAVWLSADRTSPYARRRASCTGQASSPRQRPRRRRSLAGTCRPWMGRRWRRSLPRHRAARTTRAHWAGRGRRWLMCWRRQRWPRARRRRGSF